MMSRIKDFIGRVANINARAQISILAAFFIISFPSIRNLMISNKYLMIIYSLIEVFAWLMIACVLINALFLLKSTRYSIKLSAVINILITIIITSSIVVFVWMTNLPGHNSNYNPDFGGLFGGVISGISTLILVKFTLSIQARDEIARKRKSARALYSIFSTIQDQINSLKKSDLSEILYDTSYLTYYYDISTSIKYDYYKILLSEINFVIRMNSAIRLGNCELLQKAISERQTYWSWIFTHEHNIYETISSFYFFSCDMAEELPFSENNKEEIAQIAKNYGMVIENWIYNFVLRNGSTEYRVIKLKLVPIIKEILPDTLESERKIDCAIFDVCCKFNTYNDRMKMIWNEINII